MDEQGGFILHDSGYLRESFSAFQDMRTKKEHTDVTIKTRNRLFLAHSVILAARIPHFRKILSTQDKDVLMNEIDPEVLDAIINFAYEGKLKVTAASVQSVFLAAVFLGLDQVQKACHEFQTKTFQSKEEVRTIKLIPSDENIRKNFDKFSKSGEYLLLPFCSLKELISRDDLIVTNEDKVFEAVMNWVKKTPVERRHRLPYLLPEIRFNYLSPKFLVETVAAEMFVKTSEQCRQIVEEAKSYHLLKKRPGSLSFKTAPRIYADRNKNISLRPPHLNTGVVGYNALWPLHLKTSVMPTERYCLPHNNSNKRVASATVSRNMSGDIPILNLDTHENISRGLKSSVALRHCSLSRDGSDNTVPSASCNIPENHVSKNFRNGIYAVRSFCAIGTLVSYYDTRSRKWDCFSSVSSSECPLQAVSVGEKIYVFFLKSIEMFNLVTLEWHTVEQLPVTVEGAGIVSNGNTIYIFGGRELPQIVRCFDAEWNQWLQDEVMSMPRHGMSAVSSPEADIVLSGGYNNTSCSNEVIKFHPITKVWTDMPSMICNRMDHASAVVSRKLYVCGGRNNEEEFLDTVEAYDQESSQWSFVSYLSIPRYAHSFVAWDRKLYVFGGVTKLELCSSDVEIYNPEFRECMLLGTELPVHKADDGFAVSLASGGMGVVNLRATTVTSV